MHRNHSISFLVISLVIGTAFISTMITSTAYNFSPNVEVGDVIIWKEENSAGDAFFQSYSEGLFFNKFNITNIVDEGNDTVIYADHFQSEDSPEGFVFIENKEIGRYSNYSLAPVDYLLVPHRYIIIPGTKISDYIEIIKTYLVEDAQIKSIKKGYGVKIETDTEYFYVYFNENGFLVKWAGEGGNSRVLQLYSINGEIYYIPSYPIFALLGFSLIGLIILSQTSRVKIPYSLN